MLIPPKQKIRMQTPSMKGQPSRLFCEWNINPHSKSLKNLKVLLSFSNCWYQQAIVNCFLLSLKGVNGLRSQGTSLTSPLFEGGSVSGPSLSVWAALAKDQIKKYSRINLWGFWWLQFKIYLNIQNLILCDFRLITCPCSSIDDSLAAAAGNNWLPEGLRRRRHSLLEPTFKMAAL